MDVLLLVIAIAMPFALVAMHRHTQGRSSPVAALGFILGGPVLCGVVFVAGSIYQASRASEVQGDKILGLNLGAFAFLMFPVGMVVAVVAAALYSVTIADETRIYRDGAARTAPRPTASAPLAALGLNASSTLEDLERVYREQALRLHPDRGGDPAQFKRLQDRYERAKKFLRNRQPNQLV